jgi:drug/metabolite transporter (DMT)-like permease
MSHVVTTVMFPSRPASPPIQARLVVSLFAVYVVWSSTYLAIAIAIEHMSPLMMASIRFFIAGALMLAIARRRGAPWPSARDWLRSLPVGALLFLGGNGLIALAERTVSSGGAAVVCATMPLWVGVLGVFVGDRPTLREWGSLVLGFGGVLVLMRGPTLAGEPLDIAFAIGSPILWAIGSLLARRTKDIGGDHATTMGPALQMLTGSVALLAGAIVRREPLPLDATPSSWLAIAYLVIFGSLVAFTGYMWLLRNARPAVATSYAFVNPILAVLAGAMLHGEPLGWTTLVANVMIVGAILLVLLRARRRD